MRKLNVNDSCIGTSTVRLEPYPPPNTEERRNVTVAEPNTHTQSAKWHDWNLGDETKGEIDTHRPSGELYSPWPLHETGLHPSLSVNSTWSVLELESSIPTVLSAATVSRTLRNCLSHKLKLPVRT